MIVANPETIRPAREIPLAVEAARADDLLHDWLAEFLYQFDANHLLLCRFDVHVEPWKLRGTAASEPIDRQRHQLGMEVKAITYHGLHVEPADGGWLAEVIVDI